MVLLLELPFFLESAVFGPVEDDFAIPLTDPDGRLTKIYSSQPQDTNPPHPPSWIPSATISMIT